MVAAQLEAGKTAEEIMSGYREESRPGWLNPPRIIRDGIVLPEERPLDLFGRAKPHHRLFDATLEFVWPMYFQSAASVPLVKALEKKKRAVIIGNKGKVILTLNWLSGKIADVLLRKVYKI